MIPPEGLPVGDEEAEPKDDIPAAEVGPEPPPEAFTEEEPEPAPPAPPRMRLVACLLIGCVALGPLVVFGALWLRPHLLGLLTKAEWRPYSPDLPPHERWRAELPGAPTSWQRDVDGFLVTEVQLTLRSGAGYLIRSTTFPPTYLPDAAPAALLDAWEDLLYGEEDTRRAVTARGAASIDGRRGRGLDVLFSTAEVRVSGRVWLVVVDRSAFAILASRADGDLDHQDIRRFIRSMKLPR